MNRTNIEWTTFSANPLKYRRKSDGKTVWGCVKTSPGCAHCYSEAIALRFERGKLFNARNMEELEPFLDEQELKRMRTAKTIGGVSVDGSRCFLGDMTDLFGEWVPDDLLNRLFSDVLERRPTVTWQLLTKRAIRLRRYLSWRWGEGRIPCRHIHIGISVEDQARADERIPLLLQTPAAVRFLSCEPLLGPVDLGPWLAPHDDADCLRLGCSGIHWVIVGGESGPGARPCDVGWIRSIVEQCREAGVPCFVKQLGNYVVWNGIQGGYGNGLSNCWPDGIGWTDINFRTGLGFRVHLRDKKGGEIDEFPEDLRVRQFPEVRQ